MVRIRVSECEYEYAPTMLGTTVFVNSSLSQHTTYCSVELYGLVDPVF